MIVDEEIRALRQTLDELAHNEDDELADRYSLQRPPRPAGLYWQMRWLAGRILRWLQATGIVPANDWPVSLAHAGGSRNARPLLIWAAGMHRDELRKACDACVECLDSLPGFAPVLVTDVAEFAYFSRLGWLVEYLPRISGKGEAYDSRKAKYIARLYRTAPALPANVFLATGWQATDFRRWVTTASLSETVV